MTVNYYSPANLMKVAFGLTPNPLSKGEGPWSLVPASVSWKLIIFNRTIMTIN
jgi:hypothetical protein